MTTWRWNLGWLAALLLAGFSHAMAPDERTLFANGLYSRGLFDEAIPEYQALLANAAASSVHDLAAFRLAECYRQRGLTNEAAAAYERVIESFPESTFFARAAYRRAEIDWQEGRLRDAVKRLEALLKKNPEGDIEAAALYFCGTAHVGLDRFGDAEKNFRRLLKDHPSSSYADYARIALADVLMRENETSDEASSLLRDVVAEPETPALGAEALAKAGRLAYQAKRIDEASQLFTQLAEAYPADDWNKRVRLDAGWSHFLAGQFSPARRAAEQGLSESTEADRAAWLYLSANIARKEQRIDDATKHYDQLLALSPGQDVLLNAAYEAADMAFEAGQAGRVLELAPRAMGNPERDPAILWMHAGALRTLQRDQEAGELYARIVRDFSDSERAPVAAYQLAVIADAAGDASAAAQAFEKTADDYAGHPVAADALMAAAALRLRMNEPDAAAQAWSALLDKHPGYAKTDEALMGLARAEMQNDKNEDAAQRLERLMKEFPGSRFAAEASYVRGTLFEQAEDYEQADASYRQALEKNPSPALAREAQFRRVAALQRQGREADAAQLMNELLAAGHNGPLPETLLEWLARWNLEQKDFSSAGVAAQHLANTATSEAWRQLGFYMAGIAAREQMKTEEARTHFDYAASMGLNTRETPLSYFELGIFARDAQQYDDAVRFFARAAETAANDNAMDIRARSYLQLGLAHESRGDLAAAARHFMIVSVLFDDDRVTPESLFRAAAVQDAMGQNTARDRSVAELRARYPESEWTKQAAGRWPEE